MTEERNLLYMTALVLACLVAGVAFQQHVSLGMTADMSPARSSPDEQTIRPAAYCDRASTDESLLDDLRLHD